MSQWNCLNGRRVGRHMKALIKSIPTQWWPLCTLVGPTGHLHQLRAIRVWSYCVPILSRNFVHIIYTLFSASGRICPIGDHALGHRDLERNAGERGKREAIVAEADCSVALANQLLVAGAQFESSWQAESECGIERQRGGCDWKAG